MEPAELGPIETMSRPDIKDPIFEIITDDRHIKIWETGKVEGLKKGKRCRIINRICPELARLQTALLGATKQMILNAKVAEKKGESRIFLLFARLCALRRGRKREDIL